MGVSATDALALIHCVTPMLSSGLLSMQKQPFLPKVWCPTHNLFRHLILFNCFINKSVCTELIMCRYTQIVIRPKLYGFGF
ncbi:MAG: hypothetical protein CM15mP83_5910 [Flavobacteriaceae bacterium]|nr:MAG: hypothetical protein CM15mP83_5910 [Flavobacteriaceae bacterium]